MLRIPLDRLSVSDMVRRAELRDYFCDKDAEAVREGDTWVLELSWPGGNERHVDPNLDEGLEWWGNGVTRPTMGLAQKRSGRILTSLYDTWTLHSWSQWIERSAPSAKQSIVILHVDDHHDLAAPRLFMEGDAFLDPLTGATVDLAHPETVHQAILSGALGMGSFLTPFLYRYSNAEVRHLRQPPRSISTNDYVIVPTFDLDTLIHPGARRPAVRLDPQPGIGPGKYRITPDPKAWLDDLGPGPVLLHVDMDYFNNRYDGDSDWADRPQLLNATYAEMAAKLDEMCRALKDAALGSRIADVVISYSPGFFPAEFWAMADSRLRKLLEQIL